MQRCRRAGAKVPNDRHHRLLRSRSVCPGDCHAAEHGDELASPHGPHPLSRGLHPTTEGHVLQYSKFASLMSVWGPGATFLSHVGDVAYALVSAPQSRHRPQPRLHSITLSARATSNGGSSIPSVFAVFRLMPNSYLVGSKIGISPGLAPLSILSAMSATRCPTSEVSIP